MNCSTLMPPFHAVYVAIWMVAFPGWHITRSKVPEPDSFRASPRVAEGDRYGQGTTDRSQDRAWWRARFTLGGVPLCGGVVGAKRSDAVVEFKGGDRIAETGAVDVGAECM